MSYSRRSRYSSRSRSPYYDTRARSRSRSSDGSDVDNPGNNLYVTGLSSRVTKRDLEKHFATEGDVVDAHLVVDPWTRENRGFGFVTMATVEDANHCLKYLDQSILEGRVITVEKARRRRGRTPTPGRYLGLRTVYEHRRSPSYSPYRQSRYDSPGYSSERVYSRRSRSLSYDQYSQSPIRRRQRRSYSPADSRSYSPRGRAVSLYNTRRRYRSISHGPSPRARSVSRSSYSRSFSPRYRSSRRSYCRGVSPSYRRSLRRSYSRSVSPRYRRSSRSYSRSVSPIYRRSLRRSYSRSVSPSYRTSLRRSYSPKARKSSKRGSSRSELSGYHGGQYSRESYSHSRSVSPRSRSGTRS